MKWLYTAVRTTSEREVDRQAVVDLVNEVAAVRNARHKQFKARLVSSSSIDQLYLQAITLAPFLSRLTQKWALHCGGIFRVKYNIGC